jgi:hypothetical protein
MLAFTPRPEGTHAEQGQMVPPSSPPALATSLLHLHVVVAAKPPGFLWGW